MGFFPCPSSGTHLPSRTCVSKPVEASRSSLGDLPVGGGCVSAAGIVGRGREVHLRLAHVEETHVQLEVAAPTGLSHVGAEQGLWGEERAGGTPWLRAPEGPLSGRRSLILFPRVPWAALICGAEERKVSGVGQLIGHGWGADPRAFQKHGHLPGACEEGRLSGPRPGLPNRICVLTTTPGSPSAH